MSVSSEFISKSGRAGPAIGDPYSTFRGDEYDDSEIVMVAEVVTRRAFGRWAISARVPEFSANVWSDNNNRMPSESRKRIEASAQRECNEVRYPENIWDNSK